MSDESDKVVTDLSTALGAFLAMLIKKVREDKQEDRLRSATFELYKHYILVTPNKDQAFTSALEAATDFTRNWREIMDSVVEKVDSTK